MPQQTTPQPRWYRSQGVAFRANPTTSSAAGAIDAEQGIIPDVVMAMEGEAQGHGFSIEAEFIEQLVAYDRKHFSKIGLKARFGHPSASSETMGTQLGAFYKFRTRETADGKLQAIADLHLLEAADDSPTHPGARSWVLKMAAERPDFLMSSIVFRGTRFYQRRESGNKKPVVVDEYGYIISDPELGEVFYEFGPEGEHFYTDLVEQGAVTDHLFSNAANPHLFVSQALNFLNEHPHLKNFVRQNQDKVQAFLRELGVPQPKPQTPTPTTMSKFLDILLGKQETAEDVVMSPAEIKQLKTNMGLLEEKFTAIEKQLADATTSVDALKASLATKDTELSTATAALATATARIAELEAEPAEKHTDGPKETPKADAEKGFTGDPATQKAIAEFKAMQAAKG